MSVMQVEVLPQERSFEGYALRYNCASDPIGIERGAQVTADLGVGLPEFNVAQYFGTQPRIFLDYDHVVTAHAKPNGRAIGLLGARWLRGGEHRFLYLWTAMVADAYRKTLLFNRILNFFFESVSLRETGGVPSLIVTKTYNPVVYSIFKSVAQSVSGVEVYPRIPAERQPPHLAALALELVQGISKTLVLQPETGVVVGGQAMVAPDFFPYMDESRDDAVNEHFRTNLTRADQVLCILAVPATAQAAVYRRLTGLDQRGTHGG